MIRPDSFITLRRLEIENTHKEENNMRSNKAHRLLALLLAFVMTFSLLPTVAWATTGDDCSAAGDGSVTWSYDADTTTLTISGKGAMADYASASKTPWYSYRKTATKIVVESGVTSVGAYAFSGLTKLTSVTLSDTLKTIGYRAFRSRTGLTSIEIPNSVTEIAAVAFYQWDATKTIKFNRDKNTVLRDVALGTNWSYLANIDYNGEVESAPTAGTYGDNISWSYDVNTTTLTISGKGKMAEPAETGVLSTAIYGWHLWAGDITAVVISEGIESLSTSALESFRQMTSVQFPSTLKVVGELALSQCAGLTDVTLPEGVTTLKKQAFQFGGKNFILPSTITTIEESALSSASSVKLKMTMGQAMQNVTFGTNWKGSSTTVTYDPGLNTGWASDSVITLRSGNETFTGTLDLAKYRVTFDRAMYTPSEFTLADVTVEMDGNGTVTAPNALTVQNVSGQYMAKQQLTLVPADGVNGDSIPLDVFFNITQKEYTYQGSGTEADPYKIDGLDALAALAVRVNKGENMEGKFFKQTVDVDMTGVTDWTPINNFNGTYDGDGHCIKNFVYNNASTNKFGLFGYLGADSVVKNLTMDKSCSITARSYVGSIAYNSGGRVENCTNYGKVYAAGEAGQISNLVVGGIVSSGKYLINCVNYGDVTANPNSSGFKAEGGNTAGGIAATGYVVVGCRNYGTITGGETIGGVVGEISSYGSTPETPLGIIVGCANYGTVSARERAGGLVGVLEGIMEDCYNLATVKVSKTTVGGLVGVADNISRYTDKVGVFNSYHAGSVQYGAEEAEPVAGHLIGMMRGSGDNEKALGSLYYQQVGILPAIGNYDAGDHAAAMSLTAMQAQEFVDELNGYTNKSLYGVTWKQGDSESQNLPVCGSFETLKDYACDLTGLTINGSAALLDKNGDYYFVLPYGTDLTKVTVATTVSPRATVTPADGVMNFANGPVNFVVTAEDGTHSKTYPVNVKAAQPGGLRMLRLSACNSGDVTATTSGTILLDVNDFQQDKTEYSFTRFDGQVTAGTLGTSPYHRYWFWAIPAETGATMTAAIGDTKGTITAVDDMTASAYTNELDHQISYADLMKLGENTLTLTVTPPKGGSGTKTVYTFKLTVLPTLKTVTFAEEGLEQDQAFAPETLDYTLKVPNSVKSLTPNVAATLSDGVNMTYSPALENGKIPLDKLDNGKFTITVSDAETGAVKTVYTYTVESIGTYDAKITTTNADGAQVRVYQGDTLVTPDKNGVYSLRTDKTYTYVVVAKGYVTKTGAISQPALNKGVLDVTLTAAPTLTLPQYDAFWPNFRGNDQNMAITSVKTPTGQIDAETESSDVELLWASASGSGYGSDAVGSPIFVGGYMYAYAGSRLLKLDPATGETVASVNMASNSDFAIIPPTYADGMIFVALKEGRVQAFRADNLTSLWVYQDPLKGQSNSPITYSDGYVYVGFWNGESGAANFVCLTADYEGTSAKEALWRYTSQGGFYWAGAYANENYVVVGTDDGKSGYTSQTAKLVVFNKRTGEIVDSKEGYTGDIRSNIAYADGRVYFTSKGGYFYSEVLGADGKLSGSQAIDLGGMSTSTPVVYNSRAYVGVSGDGQFTAYSGHHIAVLDLNSWSVAYTATTQGYPQTSGLLSTNTEDGSVNVYFMDNYTPGVMRVINDSAGQTALKDGISENGQSNCAPVVFKPEGPLAQYCISSPVVDEYGTLYFKNDSGNLIALTSAVKELVVAEAPESVDVDGSKVQVTGGKIVARLANGMERDVTNVVTYCTNDKGAVEAVYTYGTDVGNYTLSTKTVPLTQHESDIKIGNGTTDGTTVDGVTSFKAGTSADAPTITVTAPAAGWTLDAENTFTVASENDVACVVLVKKADGTYQKLTATTGENGKHSFTATLAEGDSIVVALKGDVSGDGVIGMDDATQVMNAWVNETEISAIGIFAANVTNAAEAISMNNATAIMNAWVNETAFAW